MFSYDLYSAVHHIGEISGGHYVSVVNIRKSSAVGKDAQNLSSWWLYNDNDVTPIDPVEVTKASAYLLFYVRKDIQNLPYEELFKPFLANFKGEEGEIPEETEEIEPLEIGTSTDKRTSDGKLFNLDAIKFAFAEMVASNPFTFNSSNREKKIVKVTANQPDSKI